MNHVPFNQWRAQPGQPTPRGIRPDAMTGVGQPTEPERWNQLRVRPDETVEQARARIFGRGVGGEQ